MAGEVRCEGMDELLKSLHAMGDAGDRIMDKALMEGARIVQEAAKRRVPVRTGKLRDNIKIGDIRENAKGLKSIVVGPGKGDISTAFYGKFIEYGTLKKPAKPFLRPAFDESRDFVGRKMEEVIGHGIEEAFKE